MKKAALVLIPALSILIAAAASPLPDTATDEEITILVSPQTILLSSKAKGPQNVRVTVHAEIDYSLVAAYSVELAGIPAASTFADARGDLVAKFVFDDVAALLEAGEATLVLTGERIDGSLLIGQDVVRVIE